MSGPASLDLVFGEVAPFVQPSDHPLTGYSMSLPQRLPADCDV